MQRLRNKVDTQSHGWTAFKAASALGYNTAYGLHKGALGETHEKYVLANERCWMIFTLLWNFTGGLVPGWVGRLLEPAENAGELAKDLFDKTLELMNEDAKDLIKGSIMESTAAGAENSRPWEPVSDSPYTYEKKMELMLAQLALEILRPLDELVGRAASWSQAEALFWSMEFENSCPYMTDLPDNLGTSFIHKVQMTSERTMWIEWACARDERWWQKHDGDAQTDGNVMVMWDSVLDRLMDLHVPETEVTSVQRVGDAFLNRAQRVLDMPKLIKWAKKNKPLTPTELAAAHRLMTPMLRVRDQLSCPMPQSGPSLMSWPSPKANTSRLR